MALIVPPGYYSASFEFQSALGTSPFITTCGFETSSEYTPVEYANALHQIYGDTMMPYTYNTLSLQRVNLFIGNDGASGSVSSALAPVAGQKSSGTSPPIAMAAIAQKQTDFVGRSGRGRMFLPGMITEAGTDENGAIIGGDKTDIEGALSDFYDQLVPTIPEADAFRPVLLSSKSPGVPKPILGFSLAPLVGWIRGRIR